MKESRRFSTVPSHLEFENHGDYILAGGNKYLHCLDNDKLETVATYTTQWKSLHKMMTIEMGEVPHVLGFELCKDRVKLYSNDYSDLFPFRVVEEAPVVDISNEIPNYVVTKKQKQKAQV